MMNIKSQVFTLLFAFTATFSFAQESLETQKIKANHHTIYTDIVIDATPDQVWAVLTDTDGYGDWAVFLENIDGKICDQCEIDAYFRLREKKLNQIPHTISVKDGEEFAWSEKFAMGILDNHRFIVEPTPEGKTKFIQSDMAKGGLTWLLGKTVIKMEAENYPKFNQALKAEVEKRYPRS